MDSRLPRLWDTDDERCTDGTFVIDDGHQARAKTKKKPEDAIAEESKDHLKMQEEQ